MVLHECAAIVVGGAFYTKFDHFVFSQAALLLDEMLW